MKSFILPLQKDTNYQRAELGTKTSLMTFPSESLLFGGLSELKNTWVNIIPTYPFWRALSYFSGEVFLHTIPWGLFA